MRSKFPEQPLPSVKNQLELQQTGCDSFEWRGDNIPYTLSSSKQVTLSEEPYKVPSSVETEILLRVRHPPHIGNGKFSPFLAKFNETNQ
jgi:hypothetical protein